MHLNISMSKISHIEGSFDGCPELVSLIMSDNLIREITPIMFQKCKNLRRLDLDINQISKIQNLHALAELSELSLQNNRLIKMEGLSSLTKLRKLDLSFNKIAKLEGILTNHMLEIIELGKNLLTDVDCIQSPNNRLIFLSELYLYDN